MIILNILSEAIVLAMLTFLLCCILARTELFHYSVTNTIFSIWFSTLVVALYPAKIAKRKGRDVYIWYFYAWLMFPIAFIHALCIKKDVKSLKKDEFLCQCPFCAEFVNRETAICEHCNKGLLEVPDDDIPKNASSPSLQEEKSDEKKMSKITNKSYWLWDVVAVLAVLALVFYFNPVDKTFTFLGGRKDGGFSFILTTGCIVALIAMIISLRHYWKWVILTTFGAAAITILSNHIGDFEYYYNLPSTRSIYYNYIVDSFLNGLLCCIASLPMANGVRAIRKRMRR